jgi:hypothetical protein
MERRLLHPAEQQEIKRRVAIYAVQVEEHGYFDWLPRRGSGLSATDEMSTSAEEPAAVGERVLGGT